MFLISLGYMKLNYPILQPLLIPFVNILCGKINLCRVCQVLLCGTLEAVLFLFHIQSTLFVVFSLYLSDPRVLYLLIILTNSCVSSLSSFKYKNLFSLSRSVFAIGTKISS